MPAQRARSHRRRHFTALLYITPVLVLILVVYLIPIIENVRYSFARATLLRGVIEWIGFKNYIRLGEPEVLWAIGRTFVWLGVSLPAALVFGIFLALLLDDRIVGRGVLRTIIILPWVFPEAIFAVMWRLTLHPQLGVLNNALLQFGLIDGPINFLSPNGALATVIAIRIWRSTPFVVMSVLAGLQSIPRDVIEAARIDGANYWQQVRYVKLPMLKPVVWATAVILSAWTLVIFDLIFILTRGGPDQATQLLSIFVYQAAFARQDLGGASTASMVLVCVVAVLGYFYVRSATREEVG